MANIKNCFLTVGILGFVLCACGDEVGDNVELFPEIPKSEPRDVDAKLTFDLSTYDPLRSRRAPPNYREVHADAPYLITESRLAEIRKEFIYWYFDQEYNGLGFGDWQENIHASTPQLHKNLNFQLPFFGFRYNYTRLSMNGYLEFSDPPENYKYPLVFPVREWPKRNDPAFIGIFFSKCRIGEIPITDIDQRKPGVYFRLERDLQGRTDQFGVEVRERVMWDIREGVIGSETFVPKHVAMITWKNMSFAGGFANALGKTNTFQMVLATDEVYTYAIFNYLLLEWTSHTEAGGDTSGGEGGVPAFVGFNAGNGSQAVEYLPYSQRTTVRDLPIRGWANGFPGRHIFRIDEKIMLGTCNKDIAGANLPLVFAPESGNMLGGTVVNITGPCFDTNQRIRCRFDTEEVNGAVVDRNRAICIQPYLMAEGFVNFEVAIGDGKYDWKGKYFVETPATAPERIHFETNDIHETYPKEIKITWERSNLTTNNNAQIRISIWGYRETTIRPELMYIDSIETSTTNTGIYRIRPDTYKNRGNWDRLELQFGFIQINLTNPQHYSNNLTVTPVIWSRPIPLGWYFAPQWERQFGKEWAKYLCNEWIKDDRYLKNFASDLPMCPCTMEQAMSDKGRFVPDPQCDIVANPSCIYHKGALHCVRLGIPTLDGADQQCCYDKNHYLMMTYDQQWGSRPARSHNLGVLPWNEANKVPTLSNWYHDMIPFYSCCLWQHEQATTCETMRFERRPTQDCVSYQSPAVAAVFGDPHIITFDGFEYTFNGKGEFVLVHADSARQKMDVQARFEQIPVNKYGEAKATLLTSIVAKENSSSTVEVRLRPPIARWRYHLDVFVDSRRVYFDRSALKFQHFHGVTVYTPTYILNQSEVVIMFQSGAGVEVVEEKGYMTARVYLPWTFMNETRGLMGNYSYDIMDDFTLPDGTWGPAGQVNNLEVIHKDFALHWMLEDKEEKDKGGSLFVHEYGKTASYYANRTFEPEWRLRPEEIIPSNRTQEITEAHALCGDSYQCQYDYAVSLNKELAFYSKSHQDSYVNIKAANQKRVVSCGILETPKFGRKSTFLFVPGTKVTFECNTDFHLIGDERRTCGPDGRWTVPEDGYTECLRDYIYSGQQAAITSGIILGVIVPILLVLIAIYLWHINERKKNYPVTTTWRYDNKEPDLMDDSGTKFLRESKLEDVDSNGSSNNGYRNGNGDQEYNARQAGITTGIVLAVLVPIVLVILCVAWHILMKNKEADADENDQYEVRKPIYSTPATEMYNKRGGSDEGSTLPTKKETEVD